ncbi:MAG: hypothetical protein GY796_35280 [Chloroflexi bacterium]|nr:hypothetical protein [Chloroflexota bacterium]
MISPGRGIIFYSPLVVLAVPGLLLLWREKLPAEAALIVGLLLVQIATYASWWTWDGGWVWGPRFLVSTQPFLMLGLLPWLAKDRCKTLFFGLVTLGFLVQIIGVTTSPLYYLTRTHFTFTQTLYNPAASPIIGHAWDLFNRRVMLLMPSQAHGVLSRGQTILWGLVSIGLMVIGGSILSRVTKRI